MVSPSSRFASSPEMVRVLTQRLASLRASRIVFEPSRAIVWANSSSEQDLRPLIRRHSARRGARGVRRREGGLDVGGVGRRDGADERIVEGISDVDGLVAIHPLICQQHLHFSSSR
jgi:hypothetical protein